MKGNSVLNDVLSTFEAAFWSCDLQLERLERGMERAGRMSRVGDGSRKKEKRGPQGQILLYLLFSKQKKEKWVGADPSVS